MIQIIEKIDRIGVLNGLDGSKHPLTRLSLIYAGNGSGKSTLAAVLAAAGSGDTDSLSERQSLGTTDPAHVRLLRIGASKRVLNNGLWAGGPLRTRVFDTQFVDQNVHTGGEVSPSHRQGLLAIAIGTTAVDQQEKLEDAQGLVATAKAEMEGVEAAVLAMAHAVDRSCSFLTFQQLQVPDAVDSLVNEAETALVNGKNVSRLYALPRPVELQSIALDLSDLFEALVESLSALHSQARLRVADHVSHLGAESSQTSVDAWLSAGVGLAPDAECPFCGQSTVGIDLVDMYAKFFDSAYGDLRDRLDQLRNRLGGAARERLQAQLTIEYERASTVTAAWESHIDVLNLPVLEPISEALSSFGTLLDELLDQKMERFEKSVEAGDNRSLLETYVFALPVLVEEVNAGIRQARSDIETYMDSLSVSSVAELEIILVAARLSKLRVSADVQRLFAKWKIAKREVAKKNAEATAARKASKDAMNATLAIFEGVINGHLEKMQTQFRIEKVTSTYAGGPSRGNYGLKLRGSSIDISGGKPPFRIALSEGDKRTLAFAFFCATVSTEEDLRGQVIVVDDPVTSLDRHRRTYTTNTLNDFSLRGAQVIVLAHDATYLREVREKFGRKILDSHGDPRPSTELQLYRDSNGDASLSKHDLDRECESKYFRNYRQIRAFLNVEAADGALVSHTTAGEAIRPLVESYLHRRFPGHIPKMNKTLGSAILLIKAAMQGDVLSYAQPLVSELTEINEFGMRYHHDTESDIELPEPDADEVRAFAQRALRIVLGDPTLVLSSFGVR
ncbi:AAA family ATPase [Cryobacterium sp. TMT1-3]|uniref:AAA family ATPase n=1 Tax=Cryobacterium sp. TMT1-3 TaxID=1259237 RepID=UPI00141BABB7|nr:AAA family ATPase [Cryobacterium sp. TMT1-3]